MLGSMQRRALDRVQTTAAQFTNHTMDSDWETWAHRRTIARLLRFSKRTMGDGLGKRQVEKALLFEQS